MQGFFRTFGIMFTNFDTAFRTAILFFPNIIQYVGYTIPVLQMKRWLCWIVSFLLLLSCLFVTEYPLLVLSGSYCIRWAHI